MSRQKTGKRQVFSELMEGVEAMKAHRGGKLTLRTHVVAVPEVKETPGADFFVSVRESFNVSRPVWASLLRVSPRTVEKWEQGGQASPLAATFVELVSRYPDTIDRLQTLPKSISRSRRRITRNGPKPLRNRSTAAAKPLSATAKLRKAYFPKKVRVLFVGEAPPAGGTFFYAGNSQVYRELKRALEVHLGNPANFLEAFKERGYFLDDLTMEPISIAQRKRGQALTPDVQLLADRIAEYQPELVISLLKRIRGPVADAMGKAGLDPDEQHHVVSFPGNGQQGNFRREMALLLKLPLFNGDR